MYNRFGGGFGGGNMQNLLREAQKMQEKKSTKAEWKQSCALSRDSAKAGAMPAVIAIQFFGRALYFFLKAGEIFVFSG